MSYAYPAEVWTCDDCGMHSIRELEYAYDSGYPRMPVPPEGWWLITGHATNRKPHVFCGNECLRTTLVNRAGEFA